MNLTSARRPGGCPEDVPSSERDKMPALETEKTK